MQGNEINNDLRVEVTNRQILKIALPISLALLVPQINFVTNNVFLGGLGEKELGTAGITGVFYLVFALVGNGLNSGLQAMMARRAGQNLPHEMGKLYSQAIWIALLFAIAGIIITYFLSPYFLQSSLQSAEVEEQALQFLRIRIWGLPFLYLFQLSNAFLVSSNNSSLMKYAFIIEALLNIFLDYSLIYGHFGFPALGFNGAAVASVFAEIAAVIVIFSIIFYKRFQAQFSLFKYWRFNKEVALHYFRQSSPLILQYLLSIAAWLLFYVLIEHYGERPLAISNTMRNIFGVFGIFIWAFASTSNAMVSNIIGQGRKELVLLLIKKIMLISLGFTSVLCLLMNIFPGVFLGLFSNQESFIEEAIPVIRMVSIGVLGMSVATVWLNAVTGTGNTKINLLIEIISIGIYCLYIWLILVVWKLSLVWAWSSELLYWSILFILSYLYIRTGKWKNKII
ncbi:MAG TPA: MATE family efflux transporter [Chitinophagaceae bacterium]|nr:MATE family efflux transporter [Chitinophagaceae bacterium]